MPTVTTLSGKTVTVNYLTRDFEGYRSDILDSGGLADTYTPDWTDRSELDIGVALVEGLCFLGDVLSFYQDRCTNEALWSAAIQRRSIIKQAEQIDYTLSTYKSALVLLTIVANDVGTADKNTAIRVDTSDGSELETFVLAEDFVSSGAGTYTGVEAYHGTYVSGEVLGSSDGSAGQKYNLSRKHMTLNPDGTSSLEIWIDEGVPEKWTEVQHFKNSVASDKVYTVTISEQDIATVGFGDGANGKIPAAGTDNVLANYRVGGGHRGNQVGINKLTIIDGSPSFITSVTNPAKPSGGLNKETIEEAKELAPKTLKAMDRIVTFDDHQIIKDNVAGVAKVLAYKGPGFETIIAVAASGDDPVPSGSYDPYDGSGSGLLKNVGDFVEAAKVPPSINKPIAINVVDLVLEIDVYLHNNFRRTSVYKLVKDTLLAVLSADALDLDSTVPMSFVDDEVEDVTGVDYLDIKQFQRIPYGRRLYGSGTLTIGTFVYGVDTPRDRWTIQMLSTTTFSVSGVNAGMQVNTGTSGVAYTIDDGSFGFTLTASAATAADRWEIVTGPYIGNIEPDFDELCRLDESNLTINLFGGIG